MQDSLPCTIEEYYAMLDSRKSDETLEERLKSYVDGEGLKIKQEIGKEIYKDVFHMFTDGLAAAGNRRMPAESEIMAEKPGKYPDSGLVQGSEAYRMII